MPRRYSSEEVAWLLSQVGILLVRRGKEDIFEGFFRGKTRTAVVPRNRRQITSGTYNSILRQAGLSKLEAEEIFSRR